MLSVRIIDPVGFFLVGPCRTALPESRRGKQSKMEILFNSICGRNKISSHYPIWIVHRHAESAKAGRRSMRVHSIYNVIYSRKV